MSGSDKEFRLFGAVICIFAGVWLAIEGISYGGIWRISGGAFFIVLGMIRVVQIAGKP